VVLGSTSSTDRYVEEHRIMMQNNFGLANITSDRLDFTISMMQAMTGRTDLYASGARCPDADCRFEDFTSLGACSKCETASVQVNNEFGCTYNTISNQTDGKSTRQEFSTLQPFAEAVTRDLGTTLTSYGMDCSRSKEGFPALNMNMEVQAKNNTWGLLRGMGQSKGSPDSPDLSPDAVFGNTYLYTNESFFQTAIDGSSFRFCTSSFDTGTRSDFDTIDTFTCFETLWAPGNITQLPTFGQFRGNLTYCRVSLCAQSFHDVTIYNHTLKVGNLIGKPLILSGNASVPSDVLASVAGGSLARYPIGSISTKLLTQKIETVLYSVNFKEFMDVIISRDDAGWPEVFERVSGVASSYIRAFDWDRSQNSGRVYAVQPYFHITWTWLALPLSMVVAAIGFLVATAVYSKRKPYLFKNSILAAMHYGIEEYPGHQEDLTRKTDLDLIKAAKIIKATFGRRSNGKLGFVRDG
jgi:hypothetical protein